VWAKRSKSDGRPGNVVGYPQRANRGVGSLLLFLRLCAVLLVILRARQLIEFKLADVAVFQSTAELDDRASGHTTACTAVLAHCERHLPNRRCILNCWSQLVPICDGNSTAFFCSQVPNDAHNIQPGQDVSTHTHARYTQPRLRAQLRAL